jgi:predicted RNA binding protein YcfA (HicA-like mRNA interferase family)
MSPARTERVVASPHQRQSPHLLKSGERKIISVPVQGNQMLKPGLAARIARDAGISF